MADDMRDYYKFYGIYTDDWLTTWGGQTFHGHLVKDMISVDCNPTGESTASSSWVNGGVKFIYPHNIKQNYFMEGVIEGEVSFGDTAQSTVTDYRVTIFKLNSSTSITDLATTGVISTIYTIPANGEYVFHFWIDVFDKKELSEYDRLGVKIEWNVDHSSTTTARLQHYIDATVRPLWIDIPLML
jgi:hypothetical protein